MTLQAARRFVRQHGVVLEGGRGPVPNLAETVAGESIRGSWWAHRCGHHIFWLTRAIRDWRDVLVCRLVGGKVTYVHRRLWPALIRLAARLEPDRLAALHEEHTVSGRHQVQVVPYPRWVPADVRKSASRVTEADAVRMLGRWATSSIRFASGQPDMCSQPRNTRRRRKSRTHSPSRRKRKPNRRTR